MPLRVALVRLFTRRFTRRPMMKPNLVYLVWRFVGNGMRTYRKRATPPAYDDTPAIARELLQQGIAVGPSGRFLTDAGRTALDEASRDILDISRSDRVQAMVAAGASSTGKKDFVVDLVKYTRDVPPDEALLKVALDPKLLEVVAAYLGLWPCLYSMAAWLNFPTAAPAASSQLWHRDPEDLKIIKVFIYLVDVDEQCGPFTYIPRTHPFGNKNGRAEQLQGQKRVPEERMARVFPPAAWRVCTGPAHTMILADTLGYHRGGRPTSGQRVMVTFTYTSATPIEDPAIHVASMPPWATLEIQQAALKALLVPRPPREPRAA